MGRRAKIIPPLTAEQQALVSTHLALARQAAARLHRRRSRMGCGEYVSLDELRSECHLALVRAAAAYDPAKGASFATFAGLVIRRQLINAMLARGRRRFLPVSEMRDDADAGGFPEWLQPEDHRTAAPGERLALCEQVERVLSPLPARHRQALVLRHLDGLRHGDIAARLGVPKKSLGLLLVQAEGMARRGCAAV